MDCSMLLTRLPKGWSALMQSLICEPANLQRADAYLLHNDCCHYADVVLSWTDLLDALSHEEPTTASSGKLVFHPLLYHFPRHIQRVLLTIIHTHCHRIPRATLQIFLNVVQRGACRWAEQLLRWLRWECNARARQDSSRKIELYEGSLTEGDNDHYIFSELNKVTAARLCESIRVQERSMTAPCNNVNPHLHRLSASEHGRPSNDTHMPAGANSEHLVNMRSDEDRPLPMADDKVLKRPRDFFNDDDGDLHPVKRQRIQDDEDTVGKTEVAMERSVGRHNAEQTCEGQREKVLDTELSTRQQTDVDNLRELWTTLMPETASCDDMVIFLRYPPDKVELACQGLALDAMSEVAMATACRHVTAVAMEMSHSSSLLFARHCLLPKVSALKQNASRLMYSALTTFATSFGSELVEAVLVPSIASSLAESCHSELIIRVSGDVLTSLQKSHLLSEFLAEKSEWHNPAICMLQSLLDEKVTLTCDQLCSFVRAFDDNYTRQIGNLKFAKLLRAFINNYAKQLTTSQVESLKMVAAANKTFLQKSLLTALNKL